MLRPRPVPLLQAFKDRTGCPILLNTSFNRAGEPIVCSPLDALFCFGMAGIDALALEDFLVDRSDLPSNWMELLPDWPRLEPSGFGRGKSPVSEMLYTFV